MNQNERDSLWDRLEFIGMMLDREYRRKNDAIDEGDADTLDDANRCIAAWKEEKREIERKLKESARL